MCGVFTYLGPKDNAGEIVIDGLKRLEYRGYDSWGIAYKTTDKINIFKQVGKIGEVDVPSLNLKAANLAIGHSRWATHGGVTEINAHPHASENQEIVLVHNGIFENYLEIKELLIGKGYEIKSETDTEILAHLIKDYNLKYDFETSVKLALKDLVGRYAVVVMHEKENKIIAARKGSPLIIGVGKADDEYFIASDIPAFLPYTNKVIYLDDNQIAVIEDQNLTVYDSQTEEQIEKRIVEIDWDLESAEKGAFPHFMIKEIMEQKDSLSRAINQDTQAVMAVANAIKSAYGTYFVGCGTAGKVCMVGEYLFSKVAKKHVNFSFGSEFPYYQHFLTDKSLMICVSQSGETADTLEAIEVAQAKGVKIVAIVNVESSTMARLADHVVAIKAGPEKAVASTKATTAQMAILTLLAFAINDQLELGQQLLIETASKINDMLNPRYEEHILKLAEKIKDVESMYIIGRGPSYPIALESAIKLQEVSYIHAEGFAGGELKHGPIALITENTPVIVFAPLDDTYQEIISNATEVKARGGYIIGVSPENHPVFDYWIKVPDCKEASPIVNIIPIQILSYQLALLRQNNPDMPRNLAKSVTVK